MEDQIGENFLSLGFEPTGKFCNRVPSHFVHLPGQILCHLRKATGVRKQRFHFRYRCQLVDHKFGLQRYRPWQALQVKHGAF
ncbi:MAG TPA: hypothetical protein ENI07_03260 [Desulfobacterales bacterium]|nr:hypothetical protein [Desulfobacterales bacterium]